MQNALLLGSAIFFELIATSALKAFDGFTRPLPASLTVVGYFLFSEQLSPLKVASIGLIVLGVIGLNLAGKSA